MKRILEYLLQICQDDVNRYPGLWKVNKPSSGIPDATLYSGYSLFHEDPGETRSINWRKI